MALHFNPYHEWLGLASGVMRPTYYELLGISEREEDPQLITAGARRSLGRLAAIDPGSHRRVYEELRARIQRAQRTLSDPARRAQYDQRLKQQSAHESAPDPMAPVVFAAAQDSGELDDFPEPVAPPTAVRDPLSPMAPVWFPGAEVDSGETPAVLKGFHPSRNADPDMPLVDSRKVPATPVGSIARRAAARQKSSRYMPLLALIAAGSLLLLLALVYYLVNEPLDEVASSDIVPVGPDAVQPRALEPAPDTVAQNQSTAATDPFPASKAKRPARAKKRRQRPKAESVALPASRDGMTTADSALLSTTPPPSDPLPTPDELAELQGALTAAREALTIRDFERVGIELGKAAAVPQRPEDRPKVARLQQLANHVRAFHRAVEDAVAGLQAGDAINVGNSTVVNIVETSSNELVIRLLGMNRRYRLDDLPPGLAIAVARHALPLNAPQTKVIEGAYLATHKTADVEDLAQVRTWWQEVAATDPSVAALIPVLDDDYELGSP